MSETKEKKNCKCKLLKVLGIIVLGFKTIRSLTIQL